MDKALIKNKSYINGKWTCEGNKTFKVSNPANGKTIGFVNDGGIEITKKGIESAYKAYK